MFNKDYELDHLLDMKVNYDKYPICQGNIVLLHRMILNGISKTILADDGEPLAIISVMIIHKGVATVYVVPSERAHTSKKFSFIKGVLALRDKLDEIVYANKIRRVETLCIKDEKHDTWMEYLGFLPEGTKTAYGVNGEDFVMWSKLWV